MTLEVVPERRWRPVSGAASPGATGARSCGMAGFIVLLHVLGFGLLFGLGDPAAPAPRRRPSGVQRRRRDPGLHLRAAARLRRRPHRRRRQHDPQADRRQHRARGAGRPEAEIRKPLSVGFWFSLGHSTIVFALAFLLSVGVKALAGQVERRRLRPALGHRASSARRCPASSSGSSASSTWSCCSASSRCSARCAPASTTSSSSRST